MENLPKDPMMLMSFVNMKLRDEYSSFETMCDDMQLDRSAVEQLLAEAGFEYSEENNKFW